MFSSILNLANFPTGIPTAPTLLPLPPNRNLQTGYLANLQPPDPKLPGTMFAQIQLPPDLPPTQPIAVWAGWPDRPQRGDGNGSESGCQGEEDQDDGKRGKIGKQARGGKERKWEGQRSFRFNWDLEEVVIKQGYHIIIYK